MKKLTGILILFAIQISFVTVYSQENILLISPRDTDTIDTKNPFLTWSYLGGLPISNNRDYYRLLIVELKDEQSAAAGIIINSPIVKMDYLQGSQMFYPYDAPELKEGVWYGWQIQKIVNNVIADKSEAWKFILPVPIKPEYMKYTTLKKQFDGSYYEAIGGKIFFTMDQGYASSNLKAVIYDASMKKVQKEVNEDKKDDIEKTAEFTVLSHGTNFFELDLGSGIKAGEYELQVYDAKKQKYILKFRVKA